MEQMKHVIFNIQRFSVNDGPGIRTTVFMKGCMLNCIWCHNPESKSSHPQLMLTPSRCLGCGECLQACPKGLHAFEEDGRHLIDRSGCEACGSCVAACTGALEMCGKEMTVEEIITQVLKDRNFYANSGGGMTVSGGDPMRSPRFTLALLKRAKECGLHTCLETSGFAKWTDIEALIPYVDLFLWDFKESDSVRHREFTGVDNALILENLRRLDAAGAQIVLRCPLIPGCNVRPEHFDAIAAQAEALKNIIRVDVEPYHPLGRSKSEAIGETYAMGDMSFPPDAEVKQWIAAIAEKTDKPVQKA